MLLNASSHSNEPALLALQLAGGSVWWAGICSTASAIVNFCDRVRSRIPSIKSITAEAFPRDQSGSPQLNL
ncbi:hypothetical protein CYB_0116 [Synechococcus sp. JA-2-3B'a(2-13)]|nr:hypothetical protein CYB_0116 [Synechococcus sp. JA-2-3B'a(2-13)]